MAKSLFKNETELQNFIVASVFMAVTPDRNENAEKVEKRATQLARDMRTVAVEYKAMVENNLMEEFEKPTEEEYDKLIPIYKSAVEKVHEVFKIKELVEKEKENDEKSE